MVLSPLVVVRSDVGDVIERAARPDLEVHRLVTQLEPAAVVQELRELLGAKLVAYLGGVGETRAVQGWIDGTRTPRGPVVDRLRWALQVAMLIAGSDGPRTAQAWFQGLNPQLDDRSPAELLREGELREAGPLVAAAARAFVVGG